MYTGPLPDTTVYGNWAESIEIWDVDSDEPMDLTDATEIKVILRDTSARIDEITLTLSNGDITVPDTGIIEWNVSAGQMGQVAPGAYQVRILLIDTDDVTVPIVLGNLSVVE